MRVGTCQRANYAKALKTPKTPKKPCLQKRTYLQPPQQAWPAWKLYMCGQWRAPAQLATANSAILRLTKELAWAEEVLRALDGLRAGARGFHDRIFANEMDVAVAAARQVRLYFG